jgi:phosphoribosylformylglycinamidine synthase subunit PurL
VTRAGRIGLLAGGDEIALVGPFTPSRAGSELAKLLGDAPAGPLPPKDVQAVLDAHEKVRDGVRSGALHSAHDIAEGGLAVAIAECCLAGGIGATVELDMDLFGECPGCAFVVSGAGLSDAGFDVIGRVGGDSLEIAGRLKVGLAELREVWEGGLSRFV